MATTRKVIITCAVTGAIHTPTMTPYLPITPEQIAESAVGAARREPPCSICTLVIRRPAARRAAPRSF